LGSKRIFDAINIWPLIQHVATPINKIHVSDRGHFGVTRLGCIEQGVEALGYVVMSRAMGQALGGYMSRSANIELICPAKVVDIRLPQPFSQQQDGEMAQVTVKHQNTTRKIAARLVVAADGRDSLVRQSLGIKTTDWDYKQTAVIANITSQRAHHNVAYERFTSSGPIAVLPLSEGRSSIVWTRANTDAECTMSLDDKTFIDVFQKLFGQRLGKLLNVGVRHAYPLRLVHAHEQVRPRFALIGNAAHSLHPIAGQGFNLGLRDVATLAEVINDAQRANYDIGQLNNLNRYAAWRKRDHFRVVAFTDGLVRLFSTDFLPFTIARNVGLIASDLLPPFKRLISRQAMGLTGKLPRIARGLNL
jgi:2-octaprenyl-6-methoxyphenol hydroxylase